MTEAQVDPRVDKIRKLLAMAEAKGATDAERDSFRDKAQALMLQWEIDEATLTVAGKARLRVEDVVVKYVTLVMPKSYMAELLSVAGDVAEAVGLRAAQSTAISRLTLVGFCSDVERAELLIHSVVIQAYAAMTVYGKTLPHHYTGSDRWNARRSFIVGFGQRVSARLSALRQAVVGESVATSPGTDLVLVDKQKLVEERASGLGWSIGRARNYRVSHSAAGERAGAQADIGQSRFGTTARGSLGS